MAASRCKNQLTPHQVDDFFNSSPVSTSAMRSPARPSHSGGMFPTFPLPSSTFSNSALQFSRVTADQNIRSHRNRHRTLRIAAHGKARHAQIRRFLLNTARIRDHDGRAHLQSQEFHVRKRASEMQPARIDSKFRNTLPRPRVDREHDVHGPASRAGISECFFSRSPSSTLDGRCRVTSA